MNQIENVIVNAIVAQISAIIKEGAGTVNCQNIA